MASLSIRNGVLRRELGITSIDNQPYSTGNEAPRRKSGSRKGDHLVRRRALNEDLLLAQADLAHFIQPFRQVSQEGEITNG